MDRNICGRLKGLLAMLMCLVMVGACSVPVMAAGTKYDVDDIQIGDKFQGGDTLCKDGSDSGMFRVIYDNGTPVKMDYDYPHTGKYDIPGVNKTMMTGLTLEPGSWTVKNMEYNIEILPKGGSSTWYDIYLVSTKNDEQASSGGNEACDHDYEWETEVEPTDTTDGVALNKCTKCGDVCGRQPISCAGYYMKHCIEKIKNAKAGDTIKISSDSWNTYTLDFVKALAARRDITVVLEITSDNVKYSTTITPDTEIKVDENIQYYGPEYLLGMFKFDKV